EAGPLVDEDGLPLGLDLEHRDRDEVVALTARAAANSGDGGANELLLELSDHPRLDLHERDGAVDRLLDLVAIGHLGHGALAQRAREDEALPASTIHPAMQEVAHSSSVLVLDGGHFASAIARTSGASVASPWIASAIARS